MSLREADIRPAALLAEYLRLNEADGKALLSHSGELESRACPGCGDNDPTPAFEKNGFKLVRCGTCETLYVNPVPSADALAEFYRHSQSSDYWAKVFFPAVAEARRKPIYHPRALRVAGYADNPTRLIDVGAGTGLFLEEFHALNPDVSIAAVEPGSAHVTQLREKNVETFEGFAGEAAVDPAWSGSADVVTCFEVLEHVSDPAALFNDLAALARPGGLIIVSGLSGSGFDIETLGVLAKPVSPPHHLTFLSIDGAEKLLQRCQLALIEISTPGELDVDIVRNVALQNPDVLVDAATRHLILEADDDARREFQENLKASRKSSHMWIVARV
ncbi:MAG: class I SAM-dependent methyltransferase [Rhodospirillales bacterium]|nr:class I SAM-dependent methyltransferase [Rhodospirillales bacterium]